MKFANKRGNNLISVLIIALSLLLVACGNEDAGTQNSTGGNQESNGETVELTISNFISPEHIQNTEVFEPFVKELEEVTEGRVKATIYPGGALGAATAHYDMAATGIADITYALQSYTEGKFPLSSVVDLPFVSSNAQSGTKIIQSLYEQFDEIQAEYNETKVLWLFTNDNDQILSAKKEIKTLEDLKGLKISVPSAASSSVVEALGATPIFQPMNEVYESLQKGIVDARLGPLSALKDFKLNEVVSHVTVGNFYTTNFVVSMNKESWEGISTNDQEAIEGILEKYGALAGQKYDETASEGRKLGEETGVSFVDLTEEELEKFKASLISLQDKWVEEREAEGLPGKMVLDAALKLSEENK